MWLVITCGIPVNIQCWKSRSYVRKFLNIQISNVLPTAPQNNPKREMLLFSLYSFMLFLPFFLFSLFTFVFHDYTCNILTLHQCIIRKFTSGDGGSVMLNLPFPWTIGFIDVVNHFLFQYLKRPLFTLQLFAVSIICTNTLSNVQTKIVWLQNDTGNNNNNS